MYRRFKWDVTITLELRHHLHNSFPAWKVSGRKARKARGISCLIRFPKLCGLQLQSIRHYRSPSIIGELHLSSFLICLCIAFLLLISSPCSLLYIHKNIYKKRRFTTSKKFLRAQGFNFLITCCINYNVLLSRNFLITCRSLKSVNDTFNCLVPRYIANTLDEIFDNIVANLCSSKILIKLAHYTDNCQQIYNERKL